MFHTARMWQMVPACEAQYLPAPRIEVFQDSTKVTLFSEMEFKKKLETKLAVETPQCDETLQPVQQEPKTSEVANQSVSFLVQEYREGHDTKDAP